jgi:hypothetical protein
MPKVIYYRFFGNISDLRYHRRGENITKIMKLPSVMRFRLFFMMMENV